MQLYLIATPQQQRTLPRLRCGFAHVAYRLGEESTLLRQNVPVGLQGGLLSLSDYEPPDSVDGSLICQAVLRECNRRQYRGVLLDFESPPSPMLQSLVGALDDVLSKRKVPLYIPQSYASQGTQAIILIGTAISGGNFAQYLRENLERYQGRIALDLERLHMVFPLPATTGVGTPISREAVATLRETHNPGVFFSQELCTRYFTYQQEGQTHFVLFDDSETLQQKIRLGQSMNIGSGFLVLNEVGDLLPTLLG